MSLPSFTAMEGNRQKKPRAAPRNDPLVKRDEAGGGTAKHMPDSSGSLSSAMAKATRALGTHASRAQRGNAVVIKIASYGSGTRSLKALTDYQTKEERALDEDGRPADLDRLVDEWAQEFSDRKPSRDLIILRFDIDSDDHALARQILTQALRTDFGRREDQGDKARSGAFTINESGPNRISITLASTLTGERAERFAKEHVTHTLAGEGVKPVILADIKNRFAEHDLAVSFRGDPHFASGEKGMRHTLLSMNAQSKNGVTIASAAHLRRKENGRTEYSRGAWTLTNPTSEADIKLQATSMAKLTNTSQPRDFMHMIISAPKTVDKEQFIAAAHDWLKQQFPTHRYVCAVHNRAPNRPGETPTHAHVHVAILLKDRTGRKLDPRKHDLAQWRERFAERARERGILLTAERRTDRAAPPPVKRHEYNLVERLQNEAPQHIRQKITAKRADTPTTPKRPDAIEHAFYNEKGLRILIDKMHEAANNPNADITTGIAARSALAGLYTQHDRLADALGIDRLPENSRPKDTNRLPVSETARINGMKRDTPITPEMADKARQNIDAALARGLKGITDPAARADYIKGADVVRTLISTQLDIRAGERGRTQQERANALASNRVGGQSLGPETEPSYPSRQIASGIAPPNTPNRISTTDLDRSERTTRADNAAGKEDASIKTYAERRDEQAKERERSEPKIPDPQGKRRPDRDRSR
jgi:hypothetical protein